jgi:hypothetical protein
VGPRTWPKEAKGAGFTEAPRGALGHWIKIKDTKIDNYQCVVPTTWNGSPRDAKGQIGAFEASLMNTPVAKADEPLEILRTLHSFDPCLACSTHVMSPGRPGNDLGQGALNALKEKAMDLNAVAAELENSQQDMRKPPPVRTVYVYEAPVRLWHWINALAIMVLATGLPHRKPAAQRFGRGQRELPDGLHPLRPLRRRPTSSRSASWCASTGPSSATTTPASCSTCRSPIRPGGSRCCSSCAGTCSSKSCPKKYVGHNPMATCSCSSSSPWHHPDDLHRLRAVRRRHGPGQLAGPDVRLGDPAPRRQPGHVHSWHHLGMWGIVFVILHVYAAVREDIMSRQTMISTMISGQRTFRE